MLINYKTIVYKKIRESQMSLNSEISIHEKDEHTIKISFKCKLDRHEKLTQRVSIGQIHMKEQVGPVCFLVLLTIRKKQMFVGRHEMKCPIS